ncbi:hypothetical protein COOONC_28172 [Cooperia oncophora]
MRGCNGVVQLSSNVAITGSERSQSLGRSEDEEDIQMTKLDKLAVRVVKRVAETNELSADEGRNSIALVSLHDAHAKLAAKGHNLQAEMTTDADGSVQREQPDNNSDSVESVGHSGASFVLSFDLKLTATESNCRVRQNGVHNAAFLIFLIFTTYPPG